MNGFHGQGVRDSHSMTDISRDCAQPGYWGGKYLVSRKASLIGDMTESTQTACIYSLLATVVTVLRIYRDVEIKPSSSAPRFAFQNPLQKCKIPKFPRSAMLLLFGATTKMLCSRTGGLSVLLCTNYSIFRTASCIFFHNSATPATYSLVIWYRNIWCETDEHYHLQHDEAL